MGGAMRVESGVGWSESGSAGRAGSEAAARAVATCSGEPALVVVFASVRYDLSQLLAGVRAVTGSAPLVGASSAGALVAGRLIQPSSGVVVGVVGAGRYRFGVSAVAGLSSGLRSAGASLARQARAAAGPGGEGERSCLLIFTDGLAGNGQEIVRGIYSVTGAAVPLVGAAAGDDRRLRQCFVFCDDQVLVDGAVGVWISATEAPGVGSGHGWQPQGEPLLVTRSVGAMVCELNGRPAGVVYREALGAQAERLSGERFSAVALAHPLGVVQSDGSFAVRSLLRVNEQEELAAFAPLPEASVAWVMSATREGLLENSAKTATEALAATVEPGLLLAFSCVARYDVLGELAGEEARQVQEAAGALPSIGFYTYGEFARTTGMIGLHNATLTALAL